MVLNFCKKCDALKRKKTIDNKKIEYCINCDEEKYDFISEEKIEELNRSN